MTENKSPLHDALRDTTLITLDSARSRLATVWLTGSAIITAIVVCQSLLGRFGDKTQEAWAWLLPNIMPTLTMIVTVLGYTAMDQQASRFVVRKTFLRFSISLSTIYLMLVLLTILMQPFASGDPLQSMRVSNLWLGPFQGLVASALGVLFASKQQKRNRV
jgi:FlaA1/EpsC-like NDP-sugar epimerase